jgi:hypothetical protein
MIPRISTESVVGAQHAVPVLFGHSVPLLPGRLNHSAFSRLFFLAALARRSAAIESA